MTSEDRFLISGFSMLILGFTFGVLLGTFNFGPNYCQTEIRVEKKELAKARLPIIYEAEWTISPMPDALQWWEVDSACELAKALGSETALREFHTFLGRQIRLLKHCAVGTKLCLNKWLSMREAVDNHIKGLVLNRQLAFDGSNWWEKEETSWVAVTMMSSGNLRDLYIFIGQLLSKNASLAVRVGALDQYFKQLVKSHGGPLIDRNWNRYK